MKLLRVAVNFSHNGGVTRYIRELVPLLSQAGVFEYHATFLPADEKLPDVKELYALTPDKDWETASVKQRFRAILDKLQPNIVQFHDSPVPSLVQIASDYAATVVMVHGYGTTCPGTQYFYARSGEVCHRSFGPMCLLSAYINRCNNRHPRRLLQSYFRVAHELKHKDDANLYLVHSDAQKEMLIHNGYKPEKIALSPGVVDAAKFGNSPPQYEDIVLFVGRLSSVKGVQYLIQAMHLVARPSKVVIIGDGNYRILLEELAAKAPARHEFIFTGWLDDAAIDGWFGRAGVMVVPSIWMETFGMTGLEAMASRLPVIGSELGGIPTWLHHETNGFLVQPKHPSELAFRIEQLLGDKALAAQMGSVGRQMVEENFTIQLESRRLLEKYTGLLH